MIFIRCGSMSGIVHAGISVPTSIVIAAASFEPDRAGAFDLAERKQVADRRTDALGRRVKQRNRVDLCDRLRS